MKDQYANYVVQKMLDVVDGDQRDLLVAKIKPHLQGLKKYTYGKHLISSKYRHYCSVSGTLLTFYFVVACLEVEKQMMFSNSNNNLISTLDIETLSITEPNQQPTTTNTPTTPNTVNNTPTPGDHQSK